MGIEPKSPDELIVLMQRYNQLGRLLPCEHDLDTDDVAAVTEARLVLKEMETTLAGIKSFLRPASG